MKTELKKLKGTTIKTSIGEITLKQNYRQNNTDYDVIYFKTIGVDSICKIYDLEQAASAERFHNEMQQYNNRSLSMIYDRVYCEQIKIKKVSYGLVCFQKLDKDLPLNQCINSLTDNDKAKLAQTLLQLLQQLKQQNKIYCNVRPANIYKSADKFYIINAQFLRFAGLRSEMDSFTLETIQNNWEYWAPQFIDTYSTQTFDYSLDVYAVGCILYQLVIGKYPFDSKLSSTNGQYDKIDNKSFLYRIAQAFISKNSNRRTINFKQIIAKLSQNNIVTTPVLKQSEQPTQLDSSLQKNVKKSGNGIFGNISNVFSKMMNDSEGWFLNYVEDDDKSPNQKYLDNILIKMYKKQEKADKLSGIIQKFTNNNPTKINSIRKVLLMIGQAIRRGPQAALHSLLPNVNSIRSQFGAILVIQSFSSLLLKKIQANQKFKRTLTGNFYLSQISNFKMISIQDLNALMVYLQILIGYVSSKPHLDGSELSQSVINFACDQIYDIVSTIILSIISIRKDNQYQIRNDNLKQLQPIQKALNIYLRKLSNLSNFISAHALYSLEGEYIPYQQQIILKSTPYYTTLQYFYLYCKSYKGLTVPINYSQVLGSSKDQKKFPLSANKQTKGVVSSSDAKSYFKQQINSDDDQDFQKSSYGKIQLSQIVAQQPTKNTIKQNPIKAPNATLSQAKTTGYLKPAKNPNVNQDLLFGINLETNTHKNGKNQSTISFQQFGNMHKAESAKQPSPQKGFGDFIFFNDTKKQPVKKPPLPLKKQSKEQDTKMKKNQTSMKRSFVEFDQIFEKNVKKQIKKDNSHSAFTQFSQISNSKNTANFSAFDPFAKPSSVTSPTVQQNPLVKKILQGLKLKQLKDLIIKNKKFVIDFANLKLIKVIGSGSAGEVSYGKYNDQQVAIKKVKAKQNPNALKQFQRQLVTYMKIQSNPYLVSFVGVSQSNGDFYLVTQYCTNGSLFDLLHKKKMEIVLPWKQRLNFAIQIAEGMHYLHSMKPIIIHRDLKSLNVFVTKVEKEWRMKVADFGLSRSPDADMMTTQLGTIHWMAPQLLEGNQYSLKVDVYSYGILLWEILSRTTPYSNLHNPMAILKHVVIDKMRPNLQSIPGECPAQLIAVMQKCWAHEPGDRPTFSQVIRQLKMINL